jgi:hypothetical protein
VRRRRASNRGSDVSIDEAMQAPSRYPTQPAGDRTSVGFFAA